MRKVTFGCANSLDNFIAREDGGIDWLMWSNEVSEVMKDYWPRIDTMVLGRKTWEYAQKNFSGAKKPHGELETYVCSRTLATGERDGMTFVDDAAKLVKKLKRRKGKEICIMSGGSLGTSLLEAGLVDEIGFNIHPVLLGGGVPLFLEMKRQVDLELKECRPFKNGCVYVLYTVKN
jgi:dihydrofolate reductase